MVCPTLSQDATSASAGWVLTLGFLFTLIPFCPWLRWLRKQKECRPLLSLMALFNFAQRAFRPWERWLGKSKGWVVLSGLLAFAGPFVYEAIKTPCVTFPARGLTIALMVGSQTLLLLYGQRQANNEQQAAEARLNAIGTEVNRIGLGVNEQGARLNRIGTGVDRIGLGVKRIADGIAAGSEEEQESQERDL